MLKNESDYVDRCLRANGYTDNQIVGAFYSCDGEGPVYTDQYMILFRGDNGGLESGYVYVDPINHKAEF